MVNMSSLGKEVQGVKSIMYRKYCVEARKLAVEKVRKSNKEIETLNKLLESYYD